MWALRFEAVGKTYRVGGAGYRSLREDLSARWRRRSPASTDRRPLRRRVALDDVSFEVDEGEAFAVVGPNGAGKSTALRIAARVTAPSAGVVRVRGRVGALIEVGAGIHPELSGRENIWLYGAILGLTRPEIRSRFDSIVAFAELESALDVPVKRYSSGMQLRLGFAIAAGVEPDVLVVDEALAVGDARFQVRCLERMADLVRSGTTLLYVSHDLASVEAVCRRAALLVDGRLHATGDVASTLGAYLAWVESSGDVAGGSTAAVTDLAGRTNPVLAPGDGLVVRLSLPPDRGAATSVALGIRDGHPWNLLGALGTVPPGREPVVARCHIDSLPLSGGVYQVWASVDGTEGDGGWRQLGAFRVEEPDRPARPLWLPPVALTHRWEWDDR